MTTTCSSRWMLIFYFLDGDLWEWPPTKIVLKKQGFVPHRSAPEKKSCSFEWWASEKGLHWVQFEGASNNPCMGMFVILNHGPSCGCRMGAIRFMRRMAHWRLRAIPSTLSAAEPVKRKMCGCQFETYEVFNDQPFYFMIRMPYRQWNYSSAPCSSTAVLALGNKLDSFSLKNRTAMFVFLNQW